jgi:Tfp pilus assembly protein PilF
MLAMHRRARVLLLLAALDSAILRAAPADPVASGERELAAKNYPAAEAALRLALKKEPNSARVRSDLALALLGQHKTPEALEEAKKAASLAPEDPNVRFRYGLALSENGRPGQAAEEFEKVVRANPTAAFARRALAFAYGDAGDERAVSAFESVMKADPRDVESRRRFALYLWADSQNERGDAVLEDALQIEPGNADLHALYGSHLPVEGRFETAAQYLSRARDLGLRTPAVWIPLGDAQWNSGGLDEAAESFDAAIAAAPSNFVARLEKGRLLAFRGRPAEAVVPLEKAVELAPGSMAAWLELGRAREAAGDLSGAEAAYRRAAEIEPSLSKTRYALGLLLAKRGETDESREELRAARERYEAERVQMYEKGSLHVECNLGWVELKRGDAASAVERFRRLPGNAEVLTGLGAALSRLGRHAEALKALERARALAPEDRKAAALLTREYGLAGSAR